MLLVTHNVVEAERAVDRLAVLDAGRVVAEGTPAQLKADLEHELRLELSLEPGIDAPVDAALRDPLSPQRLACAGHRARRARCRCPRLGPASAGPAGHIGEFALTPASLEDVYVDLVSDGTGAVPPMLLAPSKEVSHARAA